MRCGVKFTMTFLPGAVAPVRPCSISCNTPYRERTRGDQRQSSGVA